MLDCKCDSTVLTTIPDNCVLEFLKDGKWIFQKLDDDNNKFVDGVNGIELESSWAGLPDAVDDTKVVITPILEEVDYPEPDILEDSENLDGAPIRVASGPQTVSAIVRLPTPEQYEAIMELGCEKNLTVYQVDNKGKFRAREVATGEYAGLIISPDTFIVTSPFKSGNTRVDQLKLRITMTFPDGWYADAAVIEPEAGFNPLTDIAPS